MPTEKEKDDEKAAAHKQYRDAVASERKEDQDKIEEARVEYFVETRRLFRLAKASRLSVMNTKYKKRKKQS